MKRSGVVHDTYWFKAKQYGWGWYPSRWQGWLCLMGFLGAVSVGSLLLLSEEPESYGPVFGYILWILGCSSVLIAICYKKGEKPRWRWGK